MTWKFENRAKCYFCSQIFCLSHDVLSSSHHIYPSQSTVAQADMLDNSPGMWDKQYCGRTKMLHLWPYQRSAKFKRLFMLYSHPLWFWHLAFHWSSTLIKRRGEGEGEKKSVSRKKQKNKRNSCQGIHQSMKDCSHRNEHSLPDYRNTFRNTRYTVTPSN